MGLPGCTKYNHGVGIFGVFFSKNRRLYLCSPSLEPAAEVEKVPKIDKRYAGFSVDTIYTIYGHIHRYCSKDQLALLDSLI